MINEIQSKSSVLTVVKVVLIVLFAAYIGIISAVVVHEAVGHGLVAMALGGEFRGIGVYWDGMGWADVDFAGLSPIRQAWVLAGGFLSTTLVAAILFSFLFEREKDRCWPFLSRRLRLLFSRTAHPIFSGMLYSKAALATFQVY